jgi:glycosyltransferase involved in cell wall biosynthesis
MLDLADLLAAEHEVMLAAPMAPGARSFFAEAERRGLRGVPLPDDEPEIQAIALRDHLAEASPDVVHVHAGIGWEGHAAARAAREAGVRAVIRTEHLPDLIRKADERVAYAAGIADVHRIVCVSAGVAASHLDAGAPSDRMRVVRNGIVPVAPTRDAERHRADLGIAADAPLAVTVGRLTAQKGYDTLLEAIPAILARVPSARFVWIGDGPLWDDLVEAVGAAGLRDIVRMIPSSDDVPGLLAAADLLVLASRFEGLPLVALEAMAAGLAVVGTRVVGLEEAVVDGVTGLLVPPDDPAALAEAVATGLGDADLRVAWGAAGRDLQAREFTAHRMARETVAVYAEALRSVPPPVRSDGQERTST